MVCVMQDAEMTCDSIDMRCEALDLSVSNDYSTSSDSDLLTAPVNFVAAEERLPRPQYVLDEEKYFSCEYEECTYRTKYKNALKRHVETQHLALIQHVCQVCSKCFKHQDNLSKHLKIHNKEEKCLLCPRLFALKQQLRQHLQNKHGVDPDIYTSRRNLPRVETPPKPLLPKPAAVSPLPTLTSPVSLPSDAPSVITVSFTSTVSPAKSPIMTMTSPVPSLTSPVLTLPVPLSSPVSSMPSQVPSSALLSPLTSRASSVSHVTSALSSMTSASSEATDIADETLDLRQVKDESSSTYVNNSSHSTSACPIDLSFQSDSFMSQAISESVVRAAVLKNPNLTLKQYSEQQLYDNSDYEPLNLCTSDPEANEASCSAYSKTGSVPDSEEIDHDPCRLHINLSPESVYDDSAMNDDESDLGGNTNEVLGGQDKHSCRQCSYIGKDSWHLRRHVADVHDLIKPFKCVHCDYGTSRRHRFLGHMRNHGQLHCTYCSFTTTDLDSYMYHLKGCLRQHCLTVTSFNCDYCTHAFQTASDLNDHLLYVHGITVFSCEVCSYTTECRDALLYHMDCHQCKGSTPVREWSADVTVYSCSVCPFRTRYNFVMKNHTGHHTGDVQKCPVVQCGFLSSSDLSIKVHIQVAHGHNMVIPTDDSGEEHTIDSTMTDDVETYRCHKCQLLFRCPESLRQHIVICEKYKLGLCTRQDGESDKIYQCEESSCEYRTKYKNALKRHTDTQHQLKCLLNCPVCQKAFKHYDNLSKHMKIHNKKEQCPVCHQMFALKQQLRLHTESRHSATLDNGNIGRYQILQRLIQA